MQFEDEIVTSKSEVFAVWSLFFSIPPYGIRLWFLVFTHFCMNAHLWQTCPCCYGECHSLIVSCVAGVVWEETIILLPDNVHYVFLSATIPNASQFAEWITFLHKQPCHVVYTESRPIPLYHYIFPAGGDGLHLVVDDKTGEFKEDNLNTAMGVLKDGELAIKRLVWVLVCVSRLH